MGVEDDVLQEIFSSLASDLPSLVPNQSEVALSPEDAAWVDSCLVKDFGHSDGNMDDNWDDVTDALLDIISSQVPSAFEVRNKTPEINDDCVLIDDEKSEAIPIWGFLRGHLSPKPPHLEENGDADMEVGGNGFLRDRLSYNPIHLEENGDGETEMAGLLRDHLSYNPGHLEENGDDEAKVAAGPTEDIESPDTIFRVWDLDTQFEVDELTKQLTTGLGVSSFRDPPPTLDDLDAAASSDKFYDDLLAGIADLSLHPRT